MLSFEVFTDQGGGYKDVVADQVAPGPLKACTELIQAKSVADKCGPQQCDRGDPVRDEACGIPSDVVKFGDGFAGVNLGIVSLDTLGGINGNGFGQRNAIEVVVRCVIPHVDHILCMGRNGGQKCAAHNIGQLLLFAAGHVVGVEIENARAV